MKLCLEILSTRKASELFLSSIVVAVSSSAMSPMRFLREENMRNKFLMAGAILLSVLAMPSLASAQSSVPPGAGVAPVDGIADNARPRFREYVVTQRTPSYPYQGDLRVGVELPSDGVTYYEVPAEYNVQKYRYTRVNDRIILVDPGTRRIIQVIE